MNKKTLKFSAAFLFAFSLMGLQAQQKVVTSGAEALGSGGQMSYTVGESMVVTVTGSEGALTNAMQSPYEVSIITSNAELPIALEVQSYPNPTSDFITIKIGTTVSPNEPLTYHIYTLDGKYLENNVINGTEATLNMSAYPSATYLVKVVKADNKSQSVFQIIKK